MNLEAWRKKREMTMEDLARYVGMTNSKIYRLCKDSKRIRLEDAMRIVDRIPEVSFEDLIK